MNTTTFPYTTSLLLLLTPRSLLCCSLMENRMLAALAKQANVAQEQIQTIHGVVQETLMTKGGGLRGRGRGGGNKYNQLGTWDDEDDESYSAGRGKASVPRKLYDDVDDLIDLTKEHKKILRDHEAMLQKHDRAGIAVEETAEVRACEKRTAQGAKDEHRSNP